MEQHRTRLRDGSEVVFYRSGAGTWACPVCGSFSLACQPWGDAGDASFEFCKECDFEFGFDDDPRASGRALPAVQDNWLRSRAIYVNSFRADHMMQQQVLWRLRAIGVVSDELSAT